MLAAATIGAGIASKLYDTVTQKTGMQKTEKGGSGFEDAMQGIARKAQAPGTRTDAATDPAKAMAALQAALLRQQEAAQARPSPA